MAASRPAIITAPTGPDVPFGLLSVANTPDAGSPPRWAGEAATWRPDQCDPPSVGAGICEPPDGATELGVVDFTEAAVTTGPGGDEFPVAYPFTINGWSLCNPMAQDYETGLARATSQIMRGESWAIERTIETGLQGNVLPNFTQATDLTPTPGTAVGIDDGIALLEQALGQTPGGGLGVIHMTRRVASLAGSSIVRDGSVLRTRLTTPVVAGAGYTGTVTIGAQTPDGAATAWIYATGFPSVYRTPVNQRGDEFASFDRATNEMLAIADREAMVVWDCLTAAVQVTLIDES